MEMNKDCQRKSVVVSQRRVIGQEKDRSHQHSINVLKGDTQIVQDQVVLVVLDPVIMDFGTSFSLLFFVSFLLASFFFQSSPPHPPPSPPSSSSFFLFKGVRLEALPDDNIPVVIVVSTVL